MFSKLEKNKPYITTTSINREKLLELARENRKNPTKAERLPWNCLRDKFHGAKFRRQQVIGDFIADFACLSHRFIIEIDGGYHFTENQIESDKQRTEILNRLGMTVLRFTNEQVFEQTENVLSVIKEYLNTGYDSTTERIK